MPVTLKEVYDIEKYGYNPDSVISNEQTLAAMDIDTSTSKVGLRMEGDQVFIPQDNTGRFSPSLLNGESDYSFIVSGAPFEIVIKFDTSYRSFNLNGTYFGLWGIPNLGNARGLFIKHTTKQIFTFSGSGASSAGATTLTDNTIYWIKLRYNGGQYITMLSNDGTNYTTQSVINDASHYVFNASYQYSWLIFNPYTDSPTDYVRTFGYTGYMYMDGCYMRDINNNIIWQPYYTRQGQSHIITKRFW